MTPANGKILMSCDLTQKNKMVVGGIELNTAGKFDSNYREKSPTIAKVVEGNEIVPAGSIILCHHNLFYLPSPYHLGDDLFSIPFSKVLFAKIDQNGDVTPICGNMIVERMIIPSLLPLPPEHQKTYDKIYKVLMPGWTKFKEGMIVMTRPSAGYTIVYNWGGEERRIVKLDSEQVCGIVNPS